jgi:hypothetical protein
MLQEKIGRTTDVSLGKTTPRGNLTLLLPAVNIFPQYFLHNKNNGTIMIMSM